MISVICKEWEALPGANRRALSQLGWPTFYAGSGAEKGASHSGSVHKDAAPDRPRWETETV